MNETVKNLRFIKNNLYLEPAMLAKTIDESIKAVEAVDKYKTAKQKILDAIDEETSYNKKRIAEILDKYL